MVLRAGPCAALIARQPRSEQRATMPQDVRIQLLEADLDHDDAEKEMLRKELTRIRQVLMGLLISIITATVMFSLALVTKAMSL